MTRQARPKLKKIPKRWNNGELTASRLKEEIVGKYGDDENVWKFMAEEVEILRKKTEESRRQSWRPLLVGVLKAVSVLFIIAAVASIVLFAWQWWGVDQRVAALKAGRVTPTVVAEATEPTPKAKEAPAETPVPQPTESPQPQVSAIIFGDLPERLYVNGNPITLTFTVKGQNLEGETISFSLNPQETDAEISAVSPVQDGAGSLTLKPGSRSRQISIAIDDHPDLQDLPSFQIYPIPNIQVAIQASATEIGDTDPVTYTLTLTNQGEKEVYLEKAECQLPPQLQFSDDSTGAKIADNLIILTKELGESLDKGGNWEYEFQTSLAENAEDSTGQVACNVIAEGLKTAISMQSPALTIVRRGIEIKNVTVDPPYMATRVESTITAEIWRGGQPLTAPVTVTITAGEASISKEVSTPTATGTITVTIKPEDGFVGKPVTVTVSSGDESNTMSVADAVYPSMTVNKQHNLRMGDNKDSVIVGVVKVGDIYPAVRKSSSEQNFVQVCCMGGHLVWDGSGTSHRTLQPREPSELSDKLEVVGSRNLLAEDKQTVILSGFPEEQDKIAMVEMVDEQQMKVRLRGWILQDNIDLSTGEIKANDDGSFPKLILSLNDENITVSFENVGFQAEVVSRRPVGQNNNLIPIIVEGYLGE